MRHKEDTLGRFVLFFPIACAYQSENLCFDAWMGLENDDA